jgi:hypothetical protein
LQGLKPVCASPLPLKWRGLRRAQAFLCQLFIGLSTVIVIQGNKIFPGFGDWYLGKTGFKSQQTSQVADPNAPNNLWKPVDDDKDYGAHGTFDARATGKSRLVWADTHLGLLGLVGTGVAGAITAAVIWRSK